jgi:hypothetical protein
MMKIGKLKDLEADEEMKITYLILEVDRNATKELFDKVVAIRHGKGKVSPTLIEKVGKDAIILKNPMAELKGAIEKL